MKPLFGIVPEEECGTQGESKRVGEEKSGAKGKWLEFRKRR